MRDRRLESAHRADQLQRALVKPDASLDSRGEVADYLDLARMLRPGVAQTEAHRARTRERMLRAGAPATGRRADAGTLDGLEPTTIHSMEIGAGGMTIRVADIESFDPARLAEVMERMQEIAAESQLEQKHAGD